MLLTVSPTGNTHINQASPRRDVVNTHQKALSINLDPGKYGTLAEIGGGQEVARWFFRVGGASGTVAKTISAYDMTFSDSIYGVCGKYVSRRRVETMLDHEYELLQERLLTSRGSESRFFAFADTVTTRSFSGKRNGHGWLGIRFQTHPGASPSQIIIHLQLWGEESIQDQETLGIFGINLIYGAYHYHQDASLLIESLADAIPIGRMEVDVVEFSGPSFDKIDNRLMCLKLVETGLAKAAIFNSEGSIMEPSELFYKKSVLIQRGTFRPVTRLTMDMLRCAMEQFIQDTGIDSQKVVVLQEMSLQNLTTHEACSGIDSADFLERVDCLSALGYPVAISNHGTFHRLVTYLFRYTQEPSGLVMGIPTLLELFKERYYADLSGGILESFGRLFKHELKLYIHPWRDPEHGQLVTAENVLVQAHLRHLYQYLHDNQYIHSIQGHDPECLDIHSHRVLEMIQCQMRGWEADVPEKVAMLIRKKGFFGSPKKRPVSDEPSQVP
ncbi:MAG: TonB-dependent receptor [Verrucomicrobiota bacterium]|nr:TonB-dependent receptor [Verrucomicrobiota bacterium]